MRTSQTARFVEHRAARESGAPSQFRLLKTDDRMKIDGPRNQPSTTFCIEFMMAFKEGPRIYFAPLVGAIRAIRAEINRATTGDERPSAISNAPDSHA
jgi:hypothetical protein